MEANMNQRVLILSALALAGCGGGGGPGGGTPPVPVTVVIHSVPLRDGFLENTGGVTTGSGMFAGDLEGTYAGVFDRPALGFDLAGAGVPPTATIQAATLSLEQYAVWGNPYGSGNLGNVLVDHVELGASLDATDFDTHTLLAGFGVLSTDATLAVKTLDVAARVQADLAAGRTFSDFRLRFSTDRDVDGADDYAGFVDTENWAGPGAAPALKIVYLP
jgi:hypothetical protein